MQPQVFYTNVFWDIQLDRDLKLSYTKERGIVLSKNPATCLRQI